MWKRMAIVACAVAVISFAARLLSAPTKGSVEYHKGGYVKAMRGPGKWLGVAPGFVRDAWARRRTERIYFHWGALTDAGYVTDKAFVVSNASSWVVADAVRGRVSGLSSECKDFVWVLGTDTNVVLVAAPVGVMNKLGQWV